MYYCDGVSTIVRSTYICRQIWNLTAAKLLEGRLKGFMVKPYQLTLEVGIEVGRLMRMGIMAHG